MEHPRERSVARVLPLRQGGCFRRGNRGLSLNGGRHGQEWFAAYPPWRIPAGDAGGIEYIAGAVRARHRRVAHAYFARREGYAPGDGGTGAALWARTGSVAAVLA